MYHYFKDPLNNYYRLELNKGEIAQWQRNTQRWHPSSISKKTEEEHRWVYTLETKDNIGVELVMLKNFSEVSLILTQGEGLASKSTKVPLERIEDPIGPGSLFSGIQSKEKQSLPHVGSQLSNQQIEKLRAHKAKLENRLFEYRFFSYVFGDCFGKGYTKSEKLREIDNLLNGKEDVDMAVVQQGRTGRILRGN
ncbi:hypothetical protein [Legionella taurinensis]|uniref:Uncharacterized protein n=1 Tax=Legionella taurinensis TaxID=70611 RepID=A0A3A5LFM2_9GAMM|nr:hypothetical protein [Legionella taurinensis]RJT44950.1 hypothetical protein D6J04_11550 [Legionella taurinensis]RJT65550.1 hypothetical protein D6J03_12195 [Legionella taurinensis]STY27276.1 Uncharacterised protein [Legionella taurinensis]